MPFSLPPGLQLTWLGHSTFLVQTAAGKRVIIDPWIANNPACPADKKDVGAVDLMLLTHGHYDHIEDAVPVAKATGCRVVAVYELAAWMMGKGVMATGANDTELVYPMNKGATLRFDELGLSVTMVHADHSCGIKDGEQIVYGGEAVGFVVTLDDGFAFYHTGDTAVFSDMEMIADLYQPKLVMLPIGNRFVMSPREAARAVTFLKSAEAVIPMHFGTFPALTGTPAAFRDELEKAGAQIEVLEMQPGETRAAA